MDERLHDNVNSFADYYHQLAYEFILYDVYALVNLNFSKISQNLEEFEVNIAHHPKHYNTILSRDNENIEITSESNQTAETIPQCNCLCSCIKNCFCHTAYCTASLTQQSIINNTDSDDGLIQELLEKRYSQIVLFFHNQRGHVNFRHIINDFRNGIFDEDPYLNSDRKFLDQLKAKSYTISPNTFICVACPQYKIRKAKRKTISDRIYTAPFQNVCCWPK